MKNKSILIGVIIVAVIVLISIGLLVTSSKNNNEDINNSLAIEIYNKYTNDVDGGIECLINNVQYSSMQNDEKIKVSRELLELYKNDKLIKNINYSNESKIFTFQYNSGEEKGNLGGLKIERFNSMFN